jgi:phosphonopyruvate decarboxylase
MQNSGIGNAVNPLLSLADPEVYSIPMLMVIGWRGEPGVKDEPQHVKQGRRTTELLDAMEIPWFLLPATLDEASAMIEEAGRRMRERMGPVAILVRTGTFESYELRQDAVTQFPMDREAAIKRIVDRLGDEDIVISTTGKASRELYEYRVERGDGLGNDFLTVGGMGHASSIAMGIAQGQPERVVVCLDGDGSTIMHMGALALIAQADLGNFLHVVINNGSHDSVGGQPTAGYDIDIPAIAMACGYRSAFSVTDADELEEQVTRLRQVQGPVMLEVRVNKGARKDLGRPKSTPVENRDALMRRLGL